MKHNYNDICEKAWQLELNFLTKNNNPNEKEYYLTNKMAWYMSKSIFINLYFTQKFYDAKNKKKGDVKPQFMGRDIIVVPHVNDDYLHLDLINPLDYIEY